MLMDLVEAEVWRRIEERKLADLKVGFKGTTSESE